MVGIVLTYFLFVVRVYDENFFFFFELVMLTGPIFSFHFLRRFLQAST